MRKISKNNNSAVTLFVSILVVFIIVSPILWAAYLSLKPTSLMFSKSITFPLEITFDHYRNAFNSKFIGYVGNGLFTSIITAMAAVALGTPTAYTLAFSKWRIRTKKRFMYIILILRMAAPTAFAIPMFLVYTKLDMIDTHFGLILAYLTFSLPLTIWLLWMFFLDVPKALMEASIIDGASVFRRYIYIAFPLAAPGILTAMILAFGACWDDFFFALVLTRYNANTGTVGVMNFLTYTGYDWGGVTSACVILTLPVIPITFFMQKYLVQGLTTGAVKQ